MKYKLLYILLFLSISLFGQTLTEGEQFFNDREYESAKEVYGSILKKKPRDKVTNYRYARCCYELGHVDEAIKHFNLAGENYNASGFYLGELYTSKYEFEKAIKAYNNYLKILKNEDENIPLTERKIKQAEMAERMLSRVEDVVIIDSIIVDKKNFLDFYSFSSDLGTLKQEIIPMDSIHFVDKITYTTQRNDRIYFSDIIDDEMYLFTSHRLIDHWSKPIELDINTESNENYPFLLLDGVTLYFGSDGQNSIGGYDIFITKFIPANSTYLTPENIGMPFNSPYNDYMMVIDELNNVGWFATDRYLPEDKVAIYTFIPNESKTIVRSENKEDLRLAAQLKTYREGEISLPSTASDKPLIQHSEEKEFEFVVHDKLIYTKPEHFKSQEAYDLWEKYNIELSSNDNRRNQLESLRNQYLSASDEQKKILSPKIIELESTIRKQEEKISNMRMQICNREIETLKNQ